jgi:hypothetical protein
VPNGRRLGHLLERLQPLRYLHDCSGCFRLGRLPGGTCTHWKAPPFHGVFQVRVPHIDLMKSICYSGPDQLGPKSVQYHCGCGTALRTVRGSLTAGGRERTSANPRRSPHDVARSLATGPAIRAPRSAREITDAAAGVHRGARECSGVAASGTGQQQAVPVIGWLSPVPGMMERFFPPSPRDWRRTVTSWAERDH